MNNINTTVVATATVLALTIGFATSAHAVTIIKDATVSLSKLPNGSQDLANDSACKEAKNKYLQEEQTYLQIGYVRGRYAVGPSDPLDHPDMSSNPITWPNVDSVAAGNIRCKSRNGNLLINCSTRIFSSVTYGHI